MEDEVSIQESGEGGKGNFRLRNILEKVMTSEKFMLRNNGDRLLVLGAWRSDVGRGQLAQVTNKEG